VRLEYQIPRKRGIAVIPGTGVLAFLRQFSFFGEVFEFFVIRPDHQAHDLVGALLVETVFVVELDFVSGLLISLVGQEPATRREKSDPTLISLTVAKVSAASSILPSTGSPI
jgi:hypothetical protein